MQWKLYYPNGTFTSLDGSWLDAPPRGIQALAIPHYTGTRQIQSNDFYIWPAWMDEPTAADLYGVIDMLIEQGLMTADQHVADFTPEQLFGWGVKWGRSLTDRAYNELYRQVVADADLIEWGAKVGRLPSER